MKKCSRCKIEKETDFFSKNKSIKDGLESSCRDCIAKRYEQNKERILKRNKKWRDENPEYFVVHDKQRWEKRREKKLESNKEWRKNHPDKCNVYSQNKRARKIGNGGTHTVKEWQDLKEKCNYTCLCCKRKEPEIKLTKDHIIPLIEGGVNSIDNIQPLCLSCNCSKNDKTIDYRENIS